MNIYPYKQIQAGRNTKWSISLASNGEVIIEQAFRGKRKKQISLKSKKEIEESAIPKHVKTVALLAMHASKFIGLGK